jgi:hypothetical protein
MPQTHNFSFATFVKVVILAAISFGTDPLAAEHEANRQAEVLYDDFERGTDTQYVGLRISESV